MHVTALVGAMTLAMLATPESPASDQEREPAVATVETAGVRVRYAPMWSPADPAAPWPLGRLETTVTLHLDGRAIEPGHYALVCHPGADHGEATLAFVRLQPSQWLRLEDLRRLPQGDPLFRAPVRFDVAAGTAPRLIVSLSPGKRRITLTARYGNAKVVREFTR